MKPTFTSGYEQPPRGSSLQNVIRKSALLNFTIILTSFPVLTFVGGADTVVPALILMAAISILIWVITFTLFSFFSLARIFLAREAAGKPLMSAPHSVETGVADRWLDETV